MAVRSLIQIDVDDGAFRQFKDLFDRYEDAVKRMPGAWGQVGKQVNVQAVSFEKLLAAMLAQSELMHRMGRRAWAVGSGI